MPSFSRSVNTISLCARAMAMTFVPASFSTAWSKTSGTYPRFLVLSIPTAQLCLWAHGNNNLLSDRHFIAATKRRVSRLFLDTISCNRMSCGCSDHLSHVGQGFISMCHLPWQREISRYSMLWVCPPIHHFSTRHSYFEAYMTEPDSTNYR
jgi:hypothetical protein